MDQKFLYVPAQGQSMDLIPLRCLFVRAHPIA